MRRIAALVMIVVLLCGISMPVWALPEFNDQYYLVDDYMQAVYDAYEADYNSGPFCSWEQYFQKDSCFAYVMSDYAFENHTGLAKTYIEIANAVLDDANLLDTDRTNVDVKVQYYEVALLSLIKTIEQNLLSYEVQSSADETMTAYDYLAEGAGAVAFLAGLPEGDVAIKGLQTLVGSVSGSMSILNECLNTLESDDDWAVLSKMWVTYDNVELILAAIEDYPHAEGDETMGYLKQAAANLRTGMKYSLLANLNNFNEFLGKSTEEVGSFVFSDVLEAVTEQDMKSIAPAMQVTDWECLSLVSKAAKFIGSVSGMFNAGVFLADCLAGTSDVLLRYHEIRAMAAARRAVLYQTQLLHLNINGVEDTAAIQEFGEYLHCLLYITARGEYCVYSLQTKDANLLTLMVDGEDREWYEPVMTRLNAEYNNVLKLFPNTELYLRDHDDNLGNVGLVTDAYSKDYTYTAKKYNYETGKTEETEITSTFHIPQINLSGTIVEQINTEIYNALYPVIEYSAEEIAEHGYLFSSEGISYRWAVNGNILSLVVLNSSAPDYGGGGNEYMVYNIDILSGDNISDESLVEAAGLSETEFNEKAKQVLGSKFWENWDPSDKEFENQGFVDFFNRQLQNTVSKANIKQSYPYINENNQLCLIAQMYTLVDAYTYWHDLNMIDFDLSPHFSNSVVDSEPAEEGFVGNQTAAQLRKSIVGSWGRDGSVFSDYDFVSDGICYWSSQKQQSGTYKILDDMTLLVSFPWMNNRYTWTDEPFEEYRSHSSEDCWYMTSSGVLLLNGICYYRDGVVISDYNTEGDLLSILQGTWVCETMGTEYRFFSDGKYEENTVFAVNDKLFRRTNVCVGRIEIIDDATANLCQNASAGFGYIPMYTKLVYNISEDKFYVGGSNKAFTRAEYE